jgi:predicted DNA-binding protein (MmcQ/YjbR family)
MLSDEAKAWLAKLKRWTAALPSVEVTTTFGNPTFKVKGRAFLVLDRYRDTDCLWLRVAPPRRSTLLAQPGWFASPYDPKRQALCVALDAIDGRTIRSLIRASYAQAAEPPVRRKPS